VAKISQNNLDKEVDFKDIITSLHGPALLRYAG